MDDYRHHVSGFFPHRDEAENAMSRLIDCGIPRERLQILDASTVSPVPEQKSQSQEVLTNVLVDGAVGTAVGTGIGALAQVALVAANVSLFVASPLVAPLVMLGWGASLGALVGAVAGAGTGIEHKEGWLADLIGDAIASGQIVLVAESHSEAETGCARRLIESSVGESQDVSMA